MNPEAREIFNRIIQKAKTDPLADHEIAFIRARQAYLKKSQLEIVEEYLTVSEEEEEKKEEEEIEKIEEEEMEADEANRTAHPAERDEERIPYKILQNEAKKLGKKYVGISRKDLEKSLKK